MKIGLFGNATVLGDADLESAIVKLSDGIYSVLSKGIDI